MIALRGLTWKHPRADRPLVEASREYEAAHDVHVTWEARSLYDFGVARLESLAQEFDLIVLDHPHVGDGAARGYLVPLDELLPAATIDALAGASVGQSHASYDYDGHQWALAIDAAAQVSAWRPDAGYSPPQTWDEVASEARRGRVIWPLCPTDAYASLLTIAANLGALGETADEFLSPATGLGVLEAIDSVASHVPAACLEMNPVDALEELASGSSPAVYAPLLFGYSNYARDGFGHTLVRFGDMPSIRRGAGPTGSLLGGTGLAVSAFSAHRAEAAAFAAWLAGDEVQAGVYVRAGGQPANRHAWGSAEANRLTHGFFEGTRATLEASWLRPRFPGFLAFQERALGLTHAYLTRERDAAGTIDLLNAAYRACQEPEAEPERSS